MSESASEIIALLPVPIGAPLVVALVVALIFRFVNPALRSAAHDDRMPFSKSCAMGLRGVCNGYDCHHPVPDRAYSVPAAPIADCPSVSTLAARRRRAMNHLTIARPVCHNT